MRQSLKILLPLLLGGAILWWMYRGMDFSTLGLVLSSGMSWRWMWLSFPFGILAQVFRALRWRHLLLPMGDRARVHTSVCAVFLSYASSLVVPRVGEVLRCGVLRRYDGCSFSRGVGTVVAERVVDMMLIAVLSLAVFAAQLPVFFTFFRQTGLSLSGVFGTFTPAGWGVTALCGVALLVFGLLVLRRMRLLSRTRTILGELREGLLSVRRVERRGVFLLHSLLIWVCYFLHFQLTFYCFSATRDLSLPVALVAFVTGTFAVLVPTPNGAGPWHFAVKTVLMLYGVAPASGALFALVVHTVQTLLVAFLGLYAVVALTLTRPVAASPEACASQPSTLTSKTSNP